MRKVIIGLISVMAIGLVFWGYMQVMDTTLPPPPAARQTADLPMPRPDNSDDRQPGQTVIHGAQQSRYVILDPVTKETRRVLGFQKLLNPEAGSSRWQVEKPYLIFYESGYQCRVESDSGTFQIETAGTNAEPKDVQDAQLHGNVVIHLTPQAGGKISDTFIYMDDLTFSSERSEFVTDGPVKVASDQIRLDGFGLILIFDAAKSRIEYMHIRDLDELRLINMAASASTAVAPDATSSAKPDRPQSVSPQTPRDVSSVTTAADSQEAAPAAPSDYYQCILDNNVVIYYGDQLRVAGADQVAIQNILFSKMNTAGGQEEPSPADQKTDVSEPRRSRPAPAAKTPSSPPTADSGCDVVVSCDGGIILKPMQDMKEAAPDADQPELSVEMSGAPLRIEQPSTGAGEQNKTLVRCGTLKYKPAEDILRLFTDVRQPEIVLSAQPSQGRIETRGNVLWNRKTQQANIAGPGRAFLASGDSADEPSEVAFGGQMELLFAQPAEERSTPVVQTINLTGGMNAILKQNGWYKTVADSAVFQFGSARSMTSAHLKGSVQVESMQPDKPQRAAADSVTLQFGPQNSLTAAHMQGGACVVSQAGQLTSSDVTIEFKPDASGAAEPAAIHASGDAVLQTGSDMSHKSAEFEARKIDYDLQTGSGLAHGPVRFTFYQPAEPNSAAVEPWIPVTVTADKNAEFIADATGSISCVMFNQNVLAVRQLKMSDSEQVDSFHSEKLTVYPEKNQTGSTDIRSIRLTEGRVFAESIRRRGDIKLSHVKLNCIEITWDRAGNTLLAAGPGKIELVANEGSSPNPAEQTGVNFRRPCVAQLVGFDSILWSLQEQTIVASGNQETMQLVYVPLVEEKPEKFIYVNSMLFNLGFAEDPTGRTVLKRIFTDRGIIYRENSADQSKTLHELIGQTLDYDALEG
ncbi:MAG: hypothetical protein L0Y36_10355, partial [Planctomycetales bacterium]|nr:hypothetical protein [Planctomycetales bacterium]